MSGNSAQYTAETLKEYRYNPEEVQIVCRLPFFLLSTYLKQTRYITSHRLFVMERAYAPTRRQEESCSGTSYLLHLHRPTIHRSPVTQGTGETAKRRKVNSLSRTSPNMKATSKGERSLDLGDELGKVNKMASSVDHQLPAN